MDLVEVPRQCVNLEFVGSCRDVPPGVGLLRQSASAVALGTSQAHCPKLSRVSSQKWGRAGIVNVKKPEKPFSLQDLSSGPFFISALSSCDALDRFCLIRNLSEEAATPTVRLLRRHLPTSGAEGPGLR